MTRPRTHREKRSVTGRFRQRRAGGAGGRSISPPPAACPATGRTSSYGPPMSLLAAYRGDRRRPAVGRPAARAPGVRMEGYFWRFTDPASGRVLIALCGVNRARDGFWSTLGVARAPDGLPADGRASRGLGRPGGARRARGRRVRRARRPADGRPRRGRAASTCASATRCRGRGARSAGRASSRPCRRSTSTGIRGCSAAARSGSATVGGERWDLDGWQVYAEKNWGAGGFPEAWWWGQAQGFDDPGALRRVRGREDPLRPAAHRGDGRRRAAAGRPAAAARRPGRLADARAGHATSRGRCARAARAGRSRSRAPRRSAARTCCRCRCRSSAATCPGAIEHLGGRMDVVVAERGREVWRGTSRLAALEHGGIERAVAEARRRGAAAARRARPHRPDRGRGRPWTSVRGPAPSGRTRAPSGPSGARRAPHGSSAGRAVDDMTTMADAPSHAGVRHAPRRPLPRRSSRTSPPSATSPTSSARSRCATSARRSSPCSASRPSSGSRTRRRGCSRCIPRTASASSPRPRRASPPSSRSTSSTG